MPGSAGPRARIDELLPHKIHAGNWPSMLLMFPRLHSATLGGLIVLYEHKVFVQSVVWAINAHDQWGVELGKKLCNTIVPLVMEPGQAVAVSSSLRGALDYLQSVRR